MFSNCTLYSVQQTSDGGYVAAGVKNGDAWLVKLAGDGKDAEYETGKDTEYENCEDTESEDGKDTESENGESIEYGNTSDSFSTRIRNYICDIFKGVFQWDYYT